MAITTQILIDTEKRFQERTKLHQKRAPLLRKVKWHGNMELHKRVQYLQELNTEEQTQKRLGRLKSVALQQLGTPRQMVNINVASNIPSDELFFERILGQSDLMNINFLEKGVYVSRTVGRIVMKNSLGSSVGYGTGFMISPRLLMTNNHVLNDHKEAAMSHVEFNYQIGSEGDIMNIEKFTLDPATFFFTDKALDFTVVAVQLQSKNGIPLHTYGWNKLIETEGKIMIGEYMNIIQHPAGRPKEMSMRSNILIDILETHLHYQTDTEPGSSGSPVFNDQWEIVALHHSTVPKRDKKGNILTIDNDVWDASMGSSCVAWIANEGVRISRIVKSIKNINSSGITRNLRNGIFDTEPPKYTDLNGMSGKATTPDNHDEKTLDGGISVREENGETVYTVPVKIRLEVGDQLKRKISVPPAPQTSGVSTSQGQIVGKAIVGSSALQKELEQVKGELEAAKSKKYYDATSDKKDAQDYYRNVALTGSKKKLFDSFSALVTDTHINEINYRPSVQLYSWVDLQPNLKLRSIYSAKEFEPEEIIEEDFRFEARLIEFSERLLKESTLSDREIAEKIALFEASAPYNCEHVVPQSWFNKKEPMRGDLHHLFTCESGCNSFRGNIPYFDFDDFEEALRTECGKREDNKFEPEAGKGEVGRAVLYFLLRYPGEINEIATEYTPERIKILLDWHNSNPITQHEKHRNAAIFKKQGNRNPLIDKPDLAGKIDFLQGLG